ncbi:MAG: SUMF1/EgtB/PvdO family nonheme iron enzyme [Acidobacteriota bacterium]
MVQRVLIENLLPNKTVEDLQQLFAGYGPIEWIYIEIDSERKKPWGYAYIALSSEAQAEQAVKQITGVGSGGKPLRLRLVENGPDIYIDKSPTLNLPPQYIFSQGVLEIREAPPGSKIQLNEIDKAEADAEGAAQIKNLLPGKYALTLIYQGRTIFQQQVQISATVHTEIHIVNKEASGVLPLKGLVKANRPRQSRRWLFVIMVLLLPLLFYSGWRWWLAQSTPFIPTTPSVPPGMVYVSAGRFIMGRNNTPDPFESPGHVVEVKRAFFLDKTEVTNGDYARFVQESGHEPPTHWGGRQPPAEIVRLPVVNVSWQDAVDYCQWRKQDGLSCRLPTEMEWELAARGVEGQIYPWGNDWRPNIVNANNLRNGPIEVGSFIGNASIYGALDMSGNVWEWTADDLTIYPLSKATPQPGVKVIRGGAFDSAPDKATGTFRGFLVPDRRNYSATGFRCSCDVP